MHSLIRWVTPATLYSVWVCFPSGSQAVTAEEVSAHKRLPQINSAKQFCVFHYIYKLQY